MGLLMGMEPPGLWARLEIRTLTCSPRGALWEQGCEAGPSSAGSPLVSKTGSFSARGGETAVALMAGPRRPPQWVSRALGLG